MDALLVRTRSQSPTFRGGTDSPCQVHAGHATGNPGQGKGMGWFDHGTIQSAVLSPSVARRRPGLLQDYHQLLFQGAQLVDTRSHQRPGHSGSRRPWSHHELKASDVPVAGVGWRRIVGIVKGAEQMRSSSPSGARPAGQRQDGAGPGCDAAANRNCCTWLVTPGATPNRFQASMHSGADVALLDLEDSVPPVGKDAARADVLDFLGGEGRTGGRGGTALGVRMNAPCTLPGLRDLVELAGAGLWPELLLVPKVEAARDVELVAQIMDAPEGPCQIWALIETPRAIQNLASIVGAPATAGVVFGAADYAAATGCRLSGRALLYPRAALAAEAAAAGLPAVDSPYFGLHDLDGLRKETEEAIELGFVGKVAVHPRQLPVIEAAFRPNPGELEAARAVVSAADKASGGITTVNGRMVGPPLVAVARAVTARAGNGPASATFKEADSE
ncbi:HpcH/HpaI aldolase/citrate lyase family protein [Streptomyces sp. NPDC059862]|uniref:HpcH/HpaI aldolase/citrate lyase family protein n=1 Tax=Streptomyces sp. NPDC059862 TaxID=3346975 RepID=UPI003652EF03